NAGLSTAIPLIQPELALHVVIAHIKPLYLRGELDFFNAFVCQTIEISSRKSKEAITFSGIDNTDQLSIFGRIRSSKLTHREKGDRICRLTVPLVVDSHPWACC